MAEQWSESGTASQTEFATRRSDSETTSPCYFISKQPPSLAAV